MSDSSVRSSSPSPLAGIGKDVQVAVRRLLKDRGFTATAVLTLALATGATTAVFTLVSAVLLRPLAYRAPRSAGLLLGLFAGLAVILAAAGVYGVLAFSVAQRTREIGIRMAIGASARSVRWWVLRRALTLAGVGIVAGLGGALLLGRSLGQLLYGVAPSDPPTALAAAAMLSGITVAAALLPANRATRVDPQEALRAE